MSRDSLASERQPKTGDCGRIILRRAAARTREMTNPPPASASANRARGDHSLFHDPPGVRDHERPDREHEQAGKPGLPERDDRGVVRAVGCGRGHERKRQPERAPNRALLDEKRMSRAESP